MMSLEATHSPPLGNSLSHELSSLETTLQSLDPGAAARLRPGLAASEIQARCESFPWQLPAEIAELYAWHDGLTRNPAGLTFLDKLLRQKDKWHGELSGRENEVAFSYKGLSLAAKFMPLEYALAGHRHLKLLNCPLDLLPVFILHCDFAKWYCMFRLEAGSHSVYCVNGRKIAPRKVTEELLAANLEFPSLSDFLSFLIQCGQEITASGNLTWPRLQSILETFFPTEKIAALKN